MIEGADTQAAIEEALQPTMTAAELAKLKVGNAAAAAGQGIDAKDAAQGRGQGRAREPGSR